MVRSRESGEWVVWWWHLAINNLCEEVSQVRNGVNQICLMGSYYWSVFKGKSGSAHHLGQGAWSVETAMSGPVYGHTNVSVYIIVCLGGWAVPLFAIFCTSVLMSIFASHLRCQWKETKKGEVFPLGHTGEEVFLFLLLFSFILYGGKGR